MSNLTSILGTDLLSDSRSTINGNFQSLNADQLQASSVLANAVIVGSSVAGKVTPLPSLGTSGQVLTSSGPGSMPSWLSLTVTSFPAASVYNAECPSVFATLNLSSTVGLASRIVMLKAANPTGSNNILSFRKAGDTDNFTGAAANDGVNVAQVTGGRAVYVNVLTNPSGVVEWGGANVSSVILTAEAYW